MRNTFIFFLVITLGIARAQVVPERLRTDLLEETDKVWYQGFPTNFTLEDAEESKFVLQRAFIASANPLLSWQIPGAIPGFRQSAYQVILSADPKQIAQNTGGVWDSGKVSSGVSSAYFPKQMHLEANRIYYWKVQVWNQADVPGGFSTVKAFRTGAKIGDYVPPFAPLIKNEDKPVAVGSAKRGSLFYDFGKDAFAQVLLTINAPKSGDTVWIHLGEHVSAPFTVERKPKGSLRYRKIPLVVRKGEHRYPIQLKSDKRNTGSKAIMMPDYIGEVLPFRYVELEVQETGIKVNDVTRHSVNYAFDDESTIFTSSDPILNQVWELCKYSMKATSFAGYYVDGDRERIPYEADALLNQLSHYATDTEFNLAKRSLDYLVYHATWPTEWSLQNLQVAWYDYLYSGDIRTVAALYSELKPKLLMPLSREDGLISTRTGKQTAEFKKSIHYDTFDGKAVLNDIVDWPQQGGLGLGKSEPGETDGFVFKDYNSVVNAFYYEALLRISTIAKELGNPTDAAFYAQAAEKVKKSFQSVFINTSSGLIRDGEGTDHSSLHANMMALAFGLVPEKYHQKVLAHIRSRGMACSVYGSQFLLDGLYNAGEAEYSLSLMNSTALRSWHNMIKTGSTITTEAWDTSFKPNQDWNHAWGAAPANIIVRKLMGVEPLAPGFSKFSVKPQPGSLEVAHLKYATLKGDVVMAVEQRNSVFRMKLTIPSGTEAEVFVPKLAKKAQVKLDGKVVKTTDAGYFFKLGTYPSGSYEIEMRAL